MMAFPKFVRITRDIPTFHGDFKTGTVAEVLSVTLLIPGRTMCGLRDLSILEPVGGKHEIAREPEKPWGDVTLPPQPTLEDVQQHAAQAAPAAASRETRESRTSGKPPKVAAGQKSLLDGPSASPAPSTPPDPPVPAVLDLDI